MGDYVDENGNGRNYTSGQLAHVAERLERQRERTIVKATEAALEHACSGIAPRVAAEAVAARFILTPTMLEAVAARVAGTMGRRMTAGDACALVCKAIEAGSPMECTTPRGQDDARVRVFVCDATDEAGDPLSFDVLPRRIAATGEWRCWPLCIGFADGTSIEWSDEVELPLVVEYAVEHYLARDP